MHRFRKKSDAVGRRTQAQYQVGSPQQQFGASNTLQRFGDRDQESDLSAQEPLRAKPAVYEPLPELPPASNFRTSLILPDLTRRFTLLRNATGQPLSVDELRSRFAEQRARGAEHSISEEEEDMLLETLGHIQGSGSNNGGVNGSPNGHGSVNGSVNGHGHTNGSVSGHSNEGSGHSEDSSTSTERVSKAGAEDKTLDNQNSFERSSVHTASSSTPPSIRSSPSSHVAKRYSNNMFGSGRVRDYSARSQKSAISAAPSISSMSLKGNSVYSEHSVRSITPEGDGSVFSSSIHSSPNANTHGGSEDDKTPVARPTPLGPPGPYDEYPPNSSGAEYRLAKALSPAALKRASMALEEALKEIEEDNEEEVEDEIVMPRSAPTARTRHSFRSEQIRFSGEPETHAKRSSAAYETGTAISPEKHGIDAEKHASPVPSYNSRTGTISPAPRLPGYIPGMPRPMTPRDPVFDSDEQNRSHSTTPRPAVSPLLPCLNGPSSPLIPASVVSSLMRRDSNATPTSPASPLFTSRSVNGSYFEEQQRDYRGQHGSTELIMEDALNSSFGDGSRRRPASPLANPAYQPLAVSSRPSTPSNITWNTGSRSRGGSVSMDESPMADPIQRTKSPAVGRSMHSPALSDSPVLDRSHVLPGPVYNWNQSTNEQCVTDDRSPPATFGPTSPVPPLTNRTLHSPTPTQSRSPAMSSSHDISSKPNNHSRRSSRQQTISSPVVLGFTHPLTFSPRPTSSRSSIASEGSSYHSDDGSRERDRDLDFFSDTSTQHTAWHDLSSTAKTSPAPLGNDNADEWDPEEIISRYAGLTKSDFVAIQDKLVSAAVAKATTPDTRQRVPSLRRRRPSTSQSNYSLNGRDTRVASPPPRVQSPPLAALTPAPAESIRSAIAPNPVLESVQTASAQPIHGHIIETLSELVLQQLDISPSARRNRDLAQALFGKSVEDASSPGSTPSEPAPAPPGKPTMNIYHQPSLSTPISTDRSPTHTRSATDGTDTLTSPKSPYPTRNASILKSPQARLNHNDLAVDVQRKAEAATASLKRGPSLAKHLDANSSSISLVRKRIDPSQISAPHLVSASTSVDTIPLRSPSVASGNLQHQKSIKLGSRLRKWGTLRGRPTAIPNGDEITPFPLDAQSARSSPAQTTRFNSSNINVPELLASASLTESSRVKAPLPSPPATSGPGLKGLMSRFRKLGADTSPETERRSVDRERRLRPEVSLAKSSSASVSPLNEYVFPNPGQSQSAPASKSHFPNSQNIIEDPSPSAPPVGWTGLPNDEQPEPSQTRLHDDAALKQLFAAASNLGLDQSLLNDLLARSPSTMSRSVKATLNRNDSTISKFKARNASLLVRNHSPVTPEGRSSREGPTARKDDQAPSNSIPRKRIPARIGTDSPSSDASASAIVRRTIIFPSDLKTSAIDVNALMRKNSQTTRRHRSPSASSITSSSRSVHDRAPTPPPPRSPTGRRFSNEPMPQLPASFSAQAETLLTPTVARWASASPMEKSSSAYDSLYEMYAGDRATSTGLSENEASLVSGPEAEHHPDLTRGVEVIELASGETIWSIVNGLRDDDAESMYASRTSFASDYSGGQHGDSVQVLFKEHTRTGSKGSISSFVPPKKLASGKTRPETKVFYSSSNQIGRLIENLSEGQEAGSFNFLPNKRPGHSNSSSFQSESDMHWTVEERLERLLGSMTTP